MPTHSPLQSLTLPTIFTFNLLILPHTLLALLNIPKMVLITNFSISIALSLLSLRINTANAANTSDIHQIFPNLGTLPGQGDYAVAYVDPETNQLVNDEVKRNSKRLTEKRGRMLTHLFTRETFDMTMLGKSSDYQ